MGHYNVFVVVDADDEHRAESAVAAALEPFSYDAVKDEFDTSGFRWDWWSLGDDPESAYFWLTDGSRRDLARVRDIDLQAMREAVASAGDETVADVGVPYGWIVDGTLSAWTDDDDSWRQAAAARWASLNGGLWIANVDCHA